MFKIKPMPGDLVCVKHTDDILIQEGTCGVIEGEVGKAKDVYSVCFNPSPMPWWDQGIVTSSGGPVRIIKSKNMVPTGQTRQQHFQYFPHGIPGAGRAKEKKKVVDVFQVDLPGI